MDFSPVYFEHLWATSLAAIPLSLAVWAACKGFVKSPATRHVLWLVVLVSFLTPTFALILGMPRQSNPFAIFGEAISFEDAEPDDLVRDDSAPSERPDKPDSILAEKAEPVAQTVVQSPEPALPHWRAPETELDRALERRTPTRVRTAHRSPFQTSSRNESLERLRRAERSAYSRASSDRSSSSAGLQSQRSRENSAASAPSRSVSPRWRSAAEPLANERRPAVRESRVTPPEAVSRSSAPSRPATATEQPETEAAESPAPAGSSAEEPDAAGDADEPETVPAAHWASPFVDVRDAIAALPSPPPALWIAGVVLLGLVVLARVARRSKLMVSAAPAPESIQLLVDDCSRLLELPESPRAYLTDGRISPMIVVGWRSRLLIPRALWNEMDLDGRRAIVVHELAHLLRRDHWVCWLQLVIGILYWWHPVVWWARRRLREEADLCCDAWVMNVLPSSRRAYAEALLKTKDYLSVRGANAPELALGVTSPKARRFARRLTMVMTERIKPRTTPMGLVAAIAIAATGAFVLPGMACPPKDKDDCQATPKPEPVLVAAPVPTPAPAPSVVLAPRVIGPNGLMLAGPIGVHPHKDHEEDEGESTFERHMRERETADTEEAVREAEQRLADLEGRIREMVEKKSKEKAAKAPKTPAAPSAPRAPRAQSPSSDTLGLVYTLPEGRLGALTQLMVRSDVPVLVRPGDGTLTVYGTRPQHRVFRAFAELIAPGEVSVTTEDGGAVEFTNRGQFENLHKNSGGDRARADRQRAERRAQRSRDEASRQAERARRQAERHAHLHREKAERQADVHRHRNEIRSELRNREQEMRQRYREIHRHQNQHRHHDLCAPRRSEELSSAYRMEIEIHREAQNAKAELMRELEAMVADVEAMAGEIEAQALAFAAEAEQSVVFSDEFEARIEQIEEQREALMEQADEMREHADEMREEAWEDEEEISEDVRAEIESAVAEIEAQAEEIARQAEMMWAEAEAAEGEAEAAEAQAEAIAEAVEAMEDEAEAVEEKIEEIMEAIEEIAEEIEEDEETIQELMEELEEELEEARQDLEEETEDADV